MPYSSSTPAVDPDKKDECHRAGAAILALLEKDLKPRQKLEAVITAADGKVTKVPLVCRIDTLDELEYYKNGGILPYVIRSLVA